MVPHPLYAVRASFRVKHIIGQGAANIYTFIGDEKLYRRHESFRFHREICSLKKDMENITDFFLKFRSSVYTRSSSHSTHTYSQTKSNKKRYGIKEHLNNNNSNKKKSQRKIM